MFSSPWLQSVALVGLCFCYLATAQTTTTSKPATTSTAATPELTAFFNYPTLGSTYRYHANDVVILDWHSNYTSPTIQIWCRSNANASAPFTGDGTFSVASSGQLEYSFDVKNGTREYPLTCHIDITNGDKSIYHEDAQTVVFSASSGLATTWSAATSWVTPSSTTSSSTTSKPTTSSSSITSTSSSTSSPTASPTPSESSDTSSLSAGAKAGIGIGVAAIAVGTLAAAAFVWRSRRRRQAAAFESSQVGVDHVQPIPPMYQAQYDPYYQGTEMYPGKDQYVPPPQSPVRYELDAQRQPNHELDSTPRG